MKKYLFPLLAAAALLSAPAAYARTMHASGAWTVLQDVNTDACFASDRAPTGGEQKIGGSYATEGKALSAIGGAVQCANPESGY